MEHLLHCPSCDGTQTHLDDVLAATASGRQVLVIATGEDEHARLHVTDVTPDSPAGIPTEIVGRRHMFWLGGHCENCGGVIRLSYRQHKGQTFVTFDVVHPATAS